MHATLVTRTYRYMTFYVLYAARSWDPRGIKKRGGDPKVVRGGFGNTLVSSLNLALQFATLVPRPHYLLLSVGSRPSNLWAPYPKRRAHSPGRRGEGSGVYPSHQWQHQHGLHGAQTRIVRTIPAQVQCTCDYSFYTWRAMHMHHVCACARHATIAENVLHQPPLPKKWLP